MVVIPRENDHNEGRALMEFVHRGPYSQPLSDLLGMQKKDVQNTNNSESPSLTRNISYADRPPTRHGSSTANASVSSSSISSSSNPSSSSSSITHNFSNEQNDTRPDLQNQKSHIQNSDKESTSSTSSSNETNVNIWSRDEDEENSKGANRKNHDTNNNEHSAISSKEKSFATKFQELSSQTQKARNNEEKVMNDKIITATSPQKRRSLTKIPSIILEHNESSETASSSSSIDSKASKKSSCKSTVSPIISSITPISKQEHDVNHNENKSYKQLLNNNINGIDHKNDGDKLSSKNIPQNEIKEKNERRKWKEQPVENSLQFSPMSNSQIKRSKTKIFAPVKRKVISNDATRPSEISLQKSNNSKLNDSFQQPFPSMFSNGISNSTKNHNKASALKTSEKPTKKEQPLRQIATATLRKEPSIKSHQIARGKSALTSKEKNGNISSSSFQSMLTTSEDNGFKLWLKQKMEINEKRRKELEEQKAREEEKKMMKKRDAEKCFELWKIESDRKLAKEREKREAAKKEQEELELAKKEEKRRGAEKTFDHWKRTYEAELNRKRMNVMAISERHARSASKLRTKKNEEAEKAFSEWLRNKEKKQRIALIQKRDEEREKEEFKKQENEYKEQSSKEAYKAWLQLKFEEQKYTKSLAYKILEFESEAKRRWPSTPWLPTGNTVARHFVGSGHRRKTLERPIYLRNSQNHRARSLH